MDSLEICLDTYHKCLTFDFVAVLLNETLDEPSNTTLPSSWAPLIEDAQTITDLFQTAQVALRCMPYARQNNSQYPKLKNIANLAFRCLSEYANIRLSYFSSAETKSAFVANLTTNLIELIGCPTVKAPAEAVLQSSLVSMKEHHTVIFSNVSTYRECCRLLSKFQNNIALRSLINSNINGLPEAYVKALFEFSVISFKCALPNKKSIVAEFMSQLNQVWFRVHIDQSSAATQDELKSMIGTVTEAVLQIELEETMKLRGDPAGIEAELQEQDDDGNDSESSEKFHAAQKKNDDYDQLAKLLRAKIEFSMSLVLQHMSRLVDEY